MFRILMAALVIGLWGCNNNKTVVLPSFYFWKTNAYQLTDAEKTMLDTMQAKKLYIKYFEVENSRLWGNAPIAKSNLEVAKWDSVTAEIIPVVFVKNEVLLQSAKNTLDSLAENIGALVEKMARRNSGKRYQEIQIDCDWTEKSKDNYFYFLQKFKKVSGKIISVTLRLYPYKYPEKMGVPPADKATLMCYNLVNALQNESKNSILDIEELKLYLNKRRKYPVHLDIALPAYSWMLVYQKNNFKGVISQRNEDLLQVLAPQKEFWYEVIKDTVVDDYYLRAGDKIKYEKIEPTVLYRACDILRKQLVFDDSTTVSIFHLDQQKLNTYSYEVFDSVFTAFSR